MSIVNYQSNTGTNVVSKIKTLNGDVVNPGDVMAVYKDMAIKNIDTSKSYTYSNNFTPTNSYAFSNVIDVSDTHYAVLAYAGGSGNSSAGGSLCVHRKSDNVQVSKIVYDDIFNNGSTDSSVLGVKIQNGRLLVAVVGKYNGTIIPYNTTMYFYVYDVDSNGNITQRYTKSFTLSGSATGNRKLVKYTNNTFIFAQTYYTASSYYISCCGVIVDPTTCIITLGNSGTPYTVTSGAGAYNSVLGMCPFSYADSSFMLTYNYLYNSNNYVYFQPLKINLTTGDISSGGGGLRTSTISSSNQAAVYVSDGIIAAHQASLLYTYSLVSGNLAQGASYPINAKRLIRLSSGLLFGFFGATVWLISIPNATTISIPYQLTVAASIKLCLMKSSTEIVIVNDTTFDLSVAQISGNTITVYNNCGNDLAGMIDSSVSIDYNSMECIGNIYHDGNDLYLCKYTATGNDVYSTLKVQKLKGYSFNFYLGRGNSNVYGIALGGASGGGILNVLIEGIAKVFAGLLTAGLVYYSSVDATATPNPPTKSNTNKIGIAIDSSSLYITNPYKLYV